MCCKYWLGFEEFYQQDLSQLITVEEEVEVDINAEGDEKYYVPVLVIPSHVLLT